jgi:hypothetical protein
MKKRLAADLGGGVRHTSAAAAAMTVFKGIRALGGKGRSDALCGCGETGSSGEIMGPRKQVHPEEANGDSGWIELRKDTKATYPLV